MGDRERMRQQISGNFGIEEFRRQIEAGWRPLAIEWERAVPEEPLQPIGEPAEPIPFGLKVAGDCTRLEDSPDEREVLLAMMELTIQDGPYSGIAGELNRRGYRTREGHRWTPVSVFQMLPRLIEVGPRIFSSEEWRQRRKRLQNTAP